MNTTTIAETSYCRTVSRIIFFAFYFLYFYFIVDPQLRFYAHTTLGDLHLFTQKEALLLDLWKAPGQLSLLVAGFFLKYLIFKWAGPLLFTVCASCLFWGTKRLCSPLNGKGAGFIPYLPVLLTFALPVEHDFVYVYMLPFFMALFFSVLYVFLPKRTIVRVPFFLICAAAVYFFGENVLFIFCASCFIYEVLARKSILFGSIIIAAAVLIPLAGTTVIWPAAHEQTHYLYNYLWYDFTGWDFFTTYVFMFSVPIAMLLAWLLGWSVLPKSFAITTQKTPGESPFSWNIGTLFFTGVGLAGAGFLFDRYLHSYLSFMPVAGPRLWLHEETLANFPPGYGIMLLAEIVLLLSAALLVYFRFSRSTAPLRVAVFLILTLLNCFFLGALGLVFALCCVIYEWFRIKKPLFTLIQILSAAAMCFVVTLLSKETVIQALVPFNPFLLHAENNEGLSALRLMRCFPLLMILASITVAWRKSSKDGTAMVTFLHRPLALPGIEMTTVLMCVTVALTIGGATFDFERHGRFRINYMARTGQWDRVLPEAMYMDSTSLNQYVRLDINRALYQTGRMSDDLFIIPQIPKYVLPEWQEPHQRLLFAETWLELGLISPAEEEAYMILAEGKHPLILLLLAKIHLVKNQPNTARVFLRTLEQQPGCASWAKPYMRYLDGIEVPSVSEEIKRLQRQAFKGERIMDKSTNAIVLLEMLLKDNPENRMAFEFWMAYNLLMVKENQLAVSLHLLKDLKVPGNHRLFQQAYLLMEDYGPKFKKDSIDIEPATRELYKRYMNVYNNREPYTQPLDAVYGFRNTYFYLVLFLESMMKR
jgi:hypothetical protein